MTLNVILGAGGFARETALVYAAAGFPFDGYLSDDEKQWGIEYEYGSCLGSIESITDEHVYFTPGIGNPDLKVQLVRRALAKGWEPETIISPRAMLPYSFPKARFSVGVGTVICAGVSGTVNVKVGNYVNVNLNCTLGHDCVIDDYVNLTPDVNVSGFVHIEEQADIGCGAVILPGVTIGRRAVIGAGATVTKDVPPNEVWVGTPAKFVRTIG